MGNRFFQWSQPHFLFIDYLSYKKGSSDSTQLLMFNVNIPIHAYMIFKVNIKKSNHSLIHTCRVL